MRFLGVDPGTSGAVASLSADGKLLGLFDLPRIAWPQADDSTAFTKWRINGAELYVLLRGAACVPDGEKAILVLEDVHPFEGNAAMTGAMMGTKHSICSIVDCIADIELRLVTPAQWKRHFGLKKQRICATMSKVAATRDLKHQSRSRAIAMYPTAAGQLHRVEDTDRAEALLMAEFGRIQFGTDLFVAAAERQAGGPTSPMPPVPAESTTGEPWKPFA